MTIKIGEFEFEIEKVNDKLKEIDAESILLQLPDGLKRRYGPLIDELEGDVKLWGGTCYGACDLPPSLDDEDVLIHVGHSDIPNLKTDYPVIFMEGRSVTSIDTPEVLFDKLNGKVALYSTVQYRNQMDEIKNTLEKKGFRTALEIGRASCRERVYCEV